MSDRYRIILGEKDARIEKVDGPSFIETSKLHFYLPASQAEALIEAVRRFDQEEA